MGSDKVISRNRSWSMTCKLLTQNNVHVLKGAWKTQMKGGWGSLLIPLRGKTSKGMMVACLQQINLSGFMIRFFCDHGNCRSNGTMTFVNTLCLKLSGKCLILLYFNGEKMLITMNFRLNE